MSEAAASVGLYVSVPFCRAKCSFCNFASGVGSAEAVERYVALLCAEVRAARDIAKELGAELPEYVDSVYFGGGTPSLLRPEPMAAIFNSLRAEFQFESKVEVTLEAAPGQMDADLLDTASKLGVNRVSLGVQSFVDREAQAVGRTHTGASCLEEIVRLRRAGVENVGLDLIAGLPYQTEASWERSLEMAAGCGLQHLSVYMLEIDEESRLGREVLGGGARLHAPAVASEELIVALYERACAMLPEAGFEQYEISNFADHGYRSQHNLKYWFRKPYLGLGLDAHSMLEGVDGRVVRWANPEELDLYVGAGSRRKVTRVSERAAFEETVFLGLRLVDGLGRKRLAAFPSGWVEELGASVKRLSRDGLMGWDEERMWLTAKGRVISGEIFGELLAGMAV